MTYRQKIIRGVNYSAVGKIMQRLLSFVVTIILARLLTPEAVGLVGMIAVFIGVAQLFSELGFGAAIIQYQEIDERHLSSIFWINLIAGIAITIILMLSAPLIAGFYGEKILIPLTIAMSLNFTVGALNDVQMALLQREMQFKRLMWVDIGSVVVSGCIAIGMALSGFGVWSLIAQLLSRTLAQVILIWFTSGWTPKFIFDWSAVKDLIGFSTNLLGANVINYVLRNIDNLLIGRYVDASSLGLYRQAYALMTLPNFLFTGILGTVMLPALAKIQNDTARVLKMVLRSQRQIAVVSMPITIGLLVVADPLIPLVFGEQWYPMVLILRILCIGGLQEPLVATAGWVFQSQGRTDLQFRWAIFNGIITIIAFAIGVQYGVIGVAMSYVVRAYIVLYMAVVLPGQLIGLTFYRYLTNMISILFCAITMGIIVWGVGQLIPAIWSDWILLILQILTGVIVYPILIFGFRLQVSKDIIDLLPAKITEKLPTWLIN